MRPLGPRDSVSAAALGRAEVGLCSQAGVAGVCTTSALPQATPLVVQEVLTVSSVHEAWKVSTRHPFKNCLTVLPLLPSLRGEIILF